MHRAQKLNVNTGPSSAAPALRPVRVLYNGNGSTADGLLDNIIIDYVPLRDVVFALLSSLTSLLYKTLIV